MRWFLLLLLAAGLLTGYGVWRSVTEASRRYGRILELVRNHEGKEGTAWNERDASELWDCIQWFVESGPGALGRRIRDSLVEGHDAGPASTLAASFRRFDAFQGRAILGEPLPRPPDPPFQLAPFRLHELLVEDERAVEALAASPVVGVRYTLVYLVSGRADAPSFAWRAIARLAERDADIDVRLAALHALSISPSASGFRPLLATLRRDRDVAVRLTALCLLGGRGDAHAAREALFEAAQAGAELSREHRVGALLDLSTAMLTGRALADDLRGYAVEGGPGVSGEFWELAERLGDVMERRAVGDLDEPPGN